jgi:homoserine dehydrogenase
MAKAAILGFGTVGSGVYEILKNKNLCDSAGEEIEVKYILDIRDFDDEEIKKYLTKDFDVIANDKEIGVVAEVMGGLHPAYEFTKKLLESGVSVVTSNKELVATYGAELLEIAQKNNASYMFEASVGGGIPVIRPMTICTKANDIQRIAGILNGTTNYILNEMFAKGKDFEDALSDAQAKGYAERNPAADVEGHDACRKLAILSSMAWGKFVDYNEIPTEGIIKITLDDVKYAEKLNSVIKLIGYSEKVDDKIYARVSPMLVPNDIIISGVNDVFNAVMVKGDSLGDAMFYGRGAGKLPTASAVVADVIDCVRHFDSKKHNIKWDAQNEGIMMNPDEKKMSFFVRCKDSKENIEKIFTNITYTELIEGENAFTVKSITQNELNEKLSALKDIVSFLRIMEA